MSERLPWLLIIALATSFGIATVKLAALRQDMATVNAQHEAACGKLADILLTLANADVRLSKDLKTVWIPERCDDCNGKGNCDGIDCQFCKAKGCPVCNNTGKRSGPCPMCQGSGKLYWEKTVREQP